MLLIDNFAYNTLYIVIESKIFLKLRTWGKSFTNTEQEIRNKK